MILNTAEKTFEHLNGCLKKMKTEIFFLSFSYERMLCSLLDYLQNQLKGKVKKLPQGKSVSRGEQ